MPSIRYLEGQTIPARDGQTILAAAIASKTRHMQECGGHARCTTCRVQIVDGLSNIAPRSREEEIMAKRKGWGEDVRLACQAKITGDVTIRALVSHRSDLFTFSMAEADRPVGQEMHLAVMFCDLRNFTSISEGLLPHDVMYIVNSYATECSEAILQNDGYIDKYIGDGIMAVFGLADKDHARVCTNAVRASLNIRHTAKRLTEELSHSFNIPFHVGVGIHFGPCVVGQVGHPSRQSFSLLGDTVNAASRIESATKELGCDIVISEAVYQNASDAFRVGDASELTLRGKEQSLSLYPVEAMAEEDPLMLVQQSLPDILPHRREVGLRFYDLLFQRHPEYRKLFPDDMEAQATSLINMMESCVVNACRPGDMESGLRELGRRHVAYGVLTKEAFDHVRACLLETLRGFLGDRFTPSLENAWASIYGMVSQGILRGIEEQLVADNAGT